LSGDAPDYVCARNTQQIFIAEAKGRYSSVSFKNREFEKWRDQFSRIEVLGTSGQAIATKGYIIASRFATEMHPRVHSTIYAEDPLTPGYSDLEIYEDHEFGKGVIRHHYARITEKMNMRLLSAALESGSQVASELQLSATVWELQIAPKGMPRRFVGGYWFGGSIPLWKIEDEKIFHNPSDPFSLNSEEATFFGVEESIFRQIASIARSSDDAAFDISQFPDPGPFYSAVSTLRDGSLVAPAEFLVPVQTIQY